MHFAAPMRARRTIGDAPSVLPGTYDFPLIQAGGRDFDLLAHSPHRPNFDRKLKSTMIGAGFNQGGGFPPRCFRRGAAQELLAAGGADSEIESAGGWSGMGFMAYTDTQLSGSLQVARLIERAPNSDSEGVPDSPGNPPCVGPCE